MQGKILIATGNPGKIREFNELLAPLAGVTFLTLNDLAITADVDETGETYAENAALKAREYARLSGLPALSDDSGLEVDALGGAPGVRSARYAPQPGATDADRRRYLLAQLSGKPQPWPARFCCVVTVVFPNGDELYGTGTCPGRIVPDERGANGFGYDPVFELPNGQTMAELASEMKNRLSHRARAVQDLLPRLEARLDC